MLIEGIEIPEPSAFSQTLKQLAATFIAQGPPSLREEDVRRARYTITNLIDDIRHPRSKEEMVGSATELYGAVADFYLRSHNQWSAKGKAVPRILQRVNPDFCRQFCNAFDEVFTSGQGEKIIALVEEVLEPHGGFLFEEHRLESPEACRKALE